MRKEKSSVSSEEEICVTPTDKGGGLGIGEKCTAQQVKTMTGTGYHKNTTGGFITKDLKNGEIHSVSLSLHVTLSARTCTVLKENRKEGVGHFYICIGVWQHSQVLSRTRPI